MRPTQEVRHQPRTEIPRQINSISRLPPKASADTEDDKEQPQRRQRPSSDIPIVLERIDQKHQQRARDELGEELPRLGHELGRVRAEDASAGVGRVAGDGADAGAAFEGVDGGLVVGVDDAGGAHGAQDLGEGVGGELAPGEFAEDAVGEGDGWVDVGA